MIHTWNGSKVTLVVVLTFFSLTTYGQNGNYVKSFVALKDSIDDLKINYNDSIINESINYFDGLGRLIQTVSRESSASRHDIVQNYLFDRYNRQSISFLPFIVNSTTGEYFEDTNLINDYPNSDQHTYYSSQSNAGIPLSDYPYSENIYELSPLNRIIEKGSVGATWQPLSTNDPDRLGKTEKYDVLLNQINDDVIIWQFVDDSISNKGYYDSTQLRIHLLIDENQHESLSFINKTGQIILKRVYGDLEKALDTYYIYDLKGNIRAVFPPELCEHLYNGDSLTSDLLNTWAFIYKYDQRNRLIEKKIPGAEPIYMLYDKRDRLVLTQDGNQRQDKDWLFTKYDKFNRPIETGLVNLDTATQCFLNANIFEQQSIFSESRDPNLTNEYTDHCFPTSSDGTNIRPLTFTYYDSYPAAWPSLFDYSPISDLSRTIPQGTYDFGSAATSVKGQVTGTKTRVLTSDLSTSEEWVWTTNYYDKKYRLIQSVSVNDYLETTDRISTLYSFAGWVLETRLTHNKIGQTETEIRRQYDYDHTGRLIDGYHQLCIDEVCQDKVLLAHNVYNELGNLIEKNLHVEGNNPPLQSIDYRYNIRGWLQSINQASLLEDPNINPDDSAPDYFGMELYYDNPIPGIDPPTN